MGRTVNGVDPEVMEPGRSLEERNYVGRHIIHTGGRCESHILVPVVPA